MEKKERLELFNRELHYINDENIRKFAEILLEDADEYFFEVAASSSGKYHPQFAKGNQGLVRHTRAVVYFTNDFNRAELEFGNIDQHQADLLIVAAIAHDIKKQGDGTSGHTLMKEHPILGAKYVWEEYGKNKECISEDDAKFICKVIRAHMGPWGENSPKTYPERIVFYADYTASRSEIDISFISNGITTADENPYAAAKPKMTVDDYVFDFGKLAGKTLKEGYDADSSYMLWIARKAGFNNVEVQNLVKEFLNKNNIIY